MVNHVDLDIDFQIIPDTCRKLKDKVHSTLHRKIDTWKDWKRGRWSTGSTKIHNTHVDSSRQHRRCTLQKHEKSPAVLTLTRTSQIVPWHFLFLFLVSLWGWWTPILRSYESKMRFSMNEACSMHFWESWYFDTAIGWVFFPTCPMVDSWRGPTCHEMGVSNFQPPF